MTTNEFEQTVHRHSLEPGKKLYNAVALAGEVGEVCNNLKKMHMANVNPEWVRQENRPLKSAKQCQGNVIDELGDSLFYLTRVAMDMGVSLDTLMTLQAEKLNDQSEKYQRTFLK